MTKNKEFYLRYDKSCYLEYRRSQKEVPGTTVKHYGWSLLEITIHGMDLWPYIGGTDDVYDTDEQERLKVIGVDEL